MAYISSYADEEQKKKDEAGAVNTSGVVNGTATGTATGAPEQQAKTPGTGFANLSQYLDMNKGAGAQLATKATEDVSKAADAYTGATQKALTEAQTKFQGATGTGQAEKLKSSIVQDADTNKQDAIGFLGSAYKGPTAGDYTAGLAADKTKLQGDLSKVDDISQQQANLEKAYGKTGNYSQGFGLLDTFLMRGDESGRQKIDEVKGKASVVGSAYDTAAKTLQQKEQEARDTLKQNQKSVMDTASQEKAKRENEALRKANVMNMQIAREKREGASNASIADAMNDEQIADMEALAEIANVDADYIRTLNPGRKPEPQAAPSTQPINEGGMIFTPTGKRFDANGNEIPPEGGVADNASLPGGAKAPSNIPVSTTSTWQAMPVPPVKKKPVSGASSGSKASKTKQR